MSLDEDLFDWFADTLKPMEMQAGTCVCTTCAVLHTTRNHSVFPLAWPWDVSHRASAAIDRIKNKINTARGEYLVASWDKFDKDALETTATTTAKDASKDAVKNTATTYHSMCGSSDQVHDTAVTLFNANNAGRSAMYRSLGVILCHINHMSSGQTYTLPTNLLKSGAANPTTSATDCNGKLKAVSTIKTELFPDATSNEDSSKACPTQSDYEAKMTFGNTAASGLIKTNLIGRQNRPSAQP